MLTITWNYGTNWLTFNLCVEEKCRSLSVGVSNLLKLSELIGSRSELLELLRVYSVSVAAEALSLYFHAFE